MPRTRYAKPTWKVNMCNRKCEKILSCPPKYRVNKAHTRCNYVGPSSIVSDTDSFDASPPLDFDAPSDIQLGGSFFRKARRTKKTTRGGKKKTTRSKSKSKGKKGTKGTKRTRKHRKSPKH